MRIAKGVQLGYYRGAGAGSWIARAYRGAQRYDTQMIGRADDTLAADGVEVFDYWQAQDAAKTWFERSTAIREGRRLGGPYTVAEAIADYLDEIAAEKNPERVKGAKYIFYASILPDLGTIEVEKLTAEHLQKWRNKLAMQPRKVRTKKAAREQATRDVADTDDARRARKATANRILTMLKAALNRAFEHGRVASDSAWRRVKPFKRVDEAVFRYLTTDEARRLVNACEEDFRKLVQGALFTGCRYQELARLTCGDVNCQNRTIVVRLSKGKVRHVVLTDEGARSFEQWTAGKARSESVFLRGDGAVWGKSHQQRPLEEASSRAAIDPAATFHILRHTHGSLLAMQGVPMAVIAKQLGHADSRMSERHYAHLAPNYVAETIRGNFPRLGFERSSASVVKMRKPTLTSL